MKIFTYIDDNIVETKEVSFLITNINELEHIKKFFEYCIKEMREMSLNEDFNHLHLSDFKDKYESLNDIELIISK